MPVKQKSKASHEQGKEVVKQKVKQNPKRNQIQGKTQKVKQIQKNNIICERSDNGAGGGTRTRTRFEAERILSPSRLPFRHPGIGLIVYFLTDRFNCFYKRNSADRH